MEKELMHVYLEELYQRFGRDTTTISMRQAAEYLHKDYRTLDCQKDFPQKKLGKRKVVPLISFARWLS